MTKDTNLSNWLQLRQVLKDHKMEDASRTLPLDAKENYERKLSAWEAYDKGGLYIVT